jgi:hypothetical protein
LAGIVDLQSSARQRFGHILTAIPAQIANSHRLFGVVCEELKILRKSSSQLWTEADYLLRSEVETEQDFLLNGLALR